MTTNMEQQIELLGKIAASLATIENQFDELLDKVDGLTTLTSTVATTIVSLSEEFLPTARRAKALMNGSPGERIRAALRSDRT